MGLPNRSKKIGIWLIALLVISFIRAPFAQGAISYNDIVAYQNGGRVLGAATPELPRVYLTTSITSTPVTGQTITVPAGGDFQAALNSANLGDQIVLTAGATYSGNFVLPNKTSGSGWITIRTSNMAGITSENNRVSPSNASAMPKIITPNVSPAITSLASAHHYRLIGIEVGTTAVNIYGNLNYGLIETGTVDPASPYGSPYSDPAKLPHDIILDRLYVHGNPNDADKRGVSLNSSNTSVVDSYISDIHGEGFDTQAIGIFNSPGPIKIVNNYLEGAGENVIFGGADPTIPNLVPSDIEIRGNHFFKPLSWKIGEPNYNGKNFSVKNLFELKSAQRILIDGNIFENNWAHSQAGTAIVLTVRNQDGGCPWCVVQDVIFTRNIIKNTPSGIGILGADYIHPTQIARRMLIQNNLLDSLSANGYAISMASGNSDNSTLYSDNPTDITYDHNTLIFPNGGNSVMVIGDYKASNIVMQNNLSSYGLYGYFGNAVGPGTVGFNAYMNNWTFQKNLMIVGDPPTPQDPYISLNSYPANNFMTTGRSTVGFVDYNSHDYRLTSSSAYHNAGTDGKDIGADIAAINTLTANVVNGNFGASPSPSPSPSPTPAPTPAPASAVYAQPTSVTFSSQAVGASSAPQMITLVNPGSSAITVSSLTITGDYTILTNYCNQGLVPNSHCDVYVTFNPTTSGIRTGTLTFVETGVSSSPQIVTLTGTGTSSGSPIPTPTPSPNPTPTSTPSPSPSPTPTPTPSPSPSGGGGGGGGSYTPPTPISGGANQAIAKLRLVNDGGTFYLIENNQKHGITNPGMLASYGFSFADAKLATSQDQALTSGSLLTPGDGSLVKSKEDPTVYLISNQKRYGFVSAKVFTDLGFKFSSVLTVTNPELQALPKATDLDNSAAIHLSGTDINKDGTVYWVGYDNQLHGYPSLDIYNSWHLKNDFSAVVPANQADMSLPMGGFVGTRIVE